MTDRIEAAVPHAARLVCAVAEGDAREAHDVLLSLTVAELHALAVTLAASVDPELPLLVGPQVPPEAGQVGQVVLAVAVALRIPSTDIYSPRKTLDLVDARHIAFWICRALDVPVTAIGRAMHRDHSTVSSGAQRVTRTPALLRRAEQIHADLVGVPSHDDAMTTPDTPEQSPVSRSPSNAHPHVRRSLIRSVHVPAEVLVQESQDTHNDQSVHNLGRTA
ncbi:bacterial DnaA helix-turn-helix domain protein [Aeromicrobium marinum DSM 15272]|uniref:Bacterial DnaA helix-turn-helix domain protein n=1 Tax=Aeromicrobium marinum DSM 15272 TaxID=585531 RepID=E2S7S0_9ACTN|nr:helix-turn-helix domain-containing protein [Aeromicrobium marinum]EFQ84736.1 bacterial DnaA helix-turn-helix domain protein [Aeromicrobium marinum DSM 15272]